ncbi:MAG TPA: exonuclease domain-containing protein [Gammaproteobacteria bacterium]|nr:exonuclease domain-containing protein [Gammaproteobacteria bacterium]
MSIKQKKLNAATRFRGLLPVVVDMETTGLNPTTDGLLEVGVVTLSLNTENQWQPAETLFYHVEPFVDARLDPEALAITGIDPDNPLRFALPEQQVLHLIFSRINELLLETGCQRAVLVGHNAWFDLAFLQAAIKRCHFRRSPFHSFTTLDTATLSALVLGETVLARAVRAAKIPFDVNQAHCAAYDAWKTAELFCYMVNKVTGLL